MSDSQRHEFDFSNLQPVEIPVTGPDGKSYILKEASSGAAKIYNNAKLKNAVLEDGQVKSVGDLGDLEPLLVSLCLFGEGDRPVSQQFIERWPAKVVTALYNKAQEISSLDEDENPLSDSLKTVLSRIGSPTSYDDLKEFVLNNKDELAKPIRNLFERDEESVKN